MKADENTRGREMLPFGLIYKSLRKSREIAENLIKRRLLIEKNRDNAHFISVETPARLLFVPKSAEIYTVNCIIINR